MKQVLVSALLLSCFSLASAQTAGQFTVATNPPLGTFSVDGQVYNGSATFFWQTGTKHLLQFLPQTLPSVPNTQSPDTIVTSASGWRDNAGLLTPSGDLVQTVTADPRITRFTMNVTPEYRVILNFFNTPDGAQPSCGGSPGNIPANVFRPGLVYIGSACYWSSAVLYFPAGPLTLNAFPYPGFVFLGWSTNISPNSPYLTTVNIAGPITVVPSFSPAKRVTFLSDPLGLNVLVDRTSTPTRPDLNSCKYQTLPAQAPATITPLCFGDFDFAPGSVHVIGGVSPQTDLNGHVWVFDSWNTGSGQNASYHAGTDTAYSDTMTAKFVPGVGITLTTTPAGLKLNVDGRQNWPNYNFVWGVGTTHQFSPVMQQTAANGRVYTFRNWSNGGANAQTLVIDSNTATTGFRATANYDVLSRLVIQTAPSGLPVSVDGVACPTPCTVDRASGSTVQLSAATSITTGIGAKLGFTNWSDGGAAQHTFAFNADLTNLTLNYTPSYLLTMATDPSAGAQFTSDPASPDWFFPANTTVTVTANTNPGFKFQRWTGDLTGTYNSGYVSMSSPRSVVALLTRVPYIAPAGIRNAAAVTPTSAVAPGSIIVIQGQSLTTATQVGRVNPLAQSIAGVSVTVGDSILPLVSVAPDQIIAQVPSSLPDGDYTLVVHSTGQDDITGTFTVLRNAPGLFNQTVNSQNFAIAFHSDGTQVTSDSPAKVGETVSLLGTGFGPVSPALFDGFQTPAQAPVLNDSVDILMGDATITPDWAGAAAGFTGYSMTKFKITDAMPSSSSPEIKVRINGQVSNTVLLPLK